MASPETGGGQAGRQYWQDADADVNGMLGGVPSQGGGFGSVSRIDIQGSRTFLARLGIGMKRGRNLIASALEPGAGIGRVTEGLLLNVAEQVDVIEPISKFTADLQAKKGVRKVLNVGLEEWRPADEDVYDLVWTQWCLGYLTDEQIVRYLEFCKASLRQGSGVIVVKENLSSSGEDLFDKTDNSVARTDEKFRDLFKQAGLKIVRTDLQRGFPETSSKRLLPVRMYGLKP